MIRDLDTSFSTSAAAAFGLDVSLKATALLLLVLAAHAAIGRRAFVRSALWNAGLAGLLLLPAATAALPRIRVACLPGREPLVTTPKPEVTPAFEPVPGEGFPSGNRAGDSGWSTSPADDRTAGVDTTVKAVRPPAPSTAIPPVAVRTETVGTSQRPIGARVWSPGWAGAALMAYAAVAGVLAVRLAGSLVAVARLRRGVVPVDDPAWVEGLERGRLRLEMSRRVALAASDRVTVPVVVGWLRPLVVLPEALAGRAGRGTIDAVLVHELAHVRRVDYAWNLLLRLVQSLYWFHPLIWVAGRLVRVERERACDDFCIQTLGDRMMYRTTLLDVAKALTQRPGPALGMAIAMATARLTKLTRRLAWIDASPGSTRCRPSPACRASITTLILIAGAGLGAFEAVRAEPQAKPDQNRNETVTATKPEAGPAPAIADVPALKKQDAGDPREPEACEVTVIDRETKKPLAGATINVSLNFKHVELQTDADGKARIPLAGRMFGKGTLGFDVWDESHVQQRFHFSNFDPKYPPIPDRVTIALLPGSETFGGLIRDEEGRPIAGATVYLSGHLDEKRDPKELLYEIHVKTDEQGRWLTRNARRMKYIDLSLSHPDFLDDVALANRLYRPPTDALRNQTDVQIMKRGIAVEGRVVDDRGQPLAGTRVLWTPHAQIINHRDELPQTTTDAGGRFRFPSVKPGQVGLIAQARGHEPGLAEVDVRAGLAPVEFRLGPGKTLKGRVVDAQGKPIAEAFVNVDNWRGYRCLGVFLHTDADGRFRWDDAPPDAVLINVNKRGYHGIMRVRGAPEGDGDEVAFTLKPSLTLTGTVVDTTTGQRIERARVERGTIDPNSKEVTWASNPTTLVMGGRFHADFDASAAPAFRLRISLAGYKPAISPEFRNNAGEVTWDVLLEKVDSPAGKVVAPDGRPVAGAMVYLVSRGRASLTLEDGKGNPRGEYLSATSDPEGSFHLPSLEPSYAIVVVHDQYFGAASKAEFEPDRKVKVAPWGRVEGVLRVGSKPAVHQAVNLENELSDLSPGNDIRTHGRATTDAQGHFVFEKIAPGGVRIARDPGDGPDRPFWDLGRLFTVRPGETTEAQVGGLGRPVVGRLVFPEAAGRSEDYFRDNHLALKGNRAQFPYPLDLIKDGRWAGWSSTWRKSEDGRDYLRDFVLRSVNVAPDGSFRFEDVPEGVYRLNTGIRQLGRQKETEPVPEFSRTFNIPAVAGGQDDEPLDLGRLPMWVRTEPEVGEPAPDFAVTTIDGRQVTLGDYRGKFLLLDFGAPWNEQSRFQVGRLDELHAAYGKDARFAILSLIVDLDTPEIRAYIAEKKQPWPQAVIGPAGLENWLARAYGIATGTFARSEMPRAFLIGPDGKLIAKDFLYREFDKSVGAALGPK